MPVVVEDLDADGLLGLLEQRKLDTRASERGKLRVAAQWCVVHPATADTGVATWGGASLPGVLGVDESLGGEGTPAVSAFAPEPVAATLGISTAAGMRLIADALDLQHRLPRIWRLVETARRSSRGGPPGRPGHPPPVASRRRPTSTSGSPRSCPSCGFGAIQTAVAMAIAKYHPELLDQREKTGQEAGWHVTLTHPKPGDFAGTSYLDVAGDTLDLTAFHDLVCDQAAQLKALGDTDELEVRKAKALGVIASQQATLDLLTLTGEAILGGQSSVVEPESSVVELVETTKPRKPKTRLYLHLTLAELLHLDGGQAVGSVEKLGPATLTKIKEWVGHSQVTIRPVLDLASTDRGRRARPAGVDARARHPPRRPLRLPLVRGRRPPLRPRPHRPLRPDGRRRTTGPDRTGEPRPALQATPPVQDLRTLALPTTRRRHLRVARTPRPHLPRHPARHPATPPQLSANRPDHPAPTGRSGLPCCPGLVLGR